MRIKSYFDSSIQTAMRQARHELGDDVILVTSRIASPELRYLGDYEVVCAAGEQETATKAGNTLELAAGGFGQIFRQQLAPAIPQIEGARESGIATIHSTLVDIGFEPVLTEALIALVRSCAPLCSVLPAQDSVSPPPAVTTALPESLGLVVPTIECAAVDEKAGPAGPQEPLAVSGCAGPDEATVSLQEGDVPIVVAKIRELAIQQSIEEMPAPEERASSREAEHASPRFTRASRVPANSGFMMMLVALGLYGITRCSRA